MSDYIIFTGAPGSRWSGVALNFYWSVDINHTDWSEERQYAHNGNLMHTGAYFDPMMEFPMTPQVWDAPFDHGSTGVKLIKSHTVSEELDAYMQYPIVMVYRNDVDCWEWWNEAGGFDIKYPNYAWYGDQQNMFRQIQKQNRGIMSFIYNNRDKVKQVKTNIQLLATLGLSSDGIEGVDNYAHKDVKVYVYKP